MFEKGLEMGLLDRFRRSGDRELREVTFGEMPDQAAFALETQDGPLAEVNRTELDFCLTEMLRDPDQFVILTAPAPINGVRFIQARMQSADADSQVDLEVAIQGGGIHLYGRACGFNDCRDAFLRYFDGRFAPDLSEYEPVLFE